MQQENTQATDNLAVIIERLDNINIQNAKEHKDIKDDNTTRLNVILEQVKKTNGSVADLSKWRYLITGALTIMNIIFIPIVLAVVIQFVLKSI